MTDTGVSDQASGDDTAVEIEDPGAQDYTVSEKFSCTIWPPVAQRLTTDSI